MQAQPDWKAVKTQALGFLKDLIRINTTNPPGGEKAAADYIAGILKKEDIPFTLLESAPGRGNVVARLRGSGKKPPLLLNAHLDVVAAEPEHWTYDPFGAVEEGGYVWGRGALDMKNMAAMSLSCLLLLKRQAVALERDVIFAGVADEEAGSEYGALFLVNEHPELVRAEYVLNEVGGYTMHIGDSRLYPIQIAEKGICWFEITAHGEPGHGSMPHPKNAVNRLARAVADLSRTRLPQHNTPVVENFIKTLAKSASFPQSAVLPLLLQSAVGPKLLDFLEQKATDQAISLNAMLRNTVSPTILKAGTKVNVIPSKASVQVDGRMIPGQNTETFLEEIRRVIGEDLEIKILTQHEGTVFDTDTDLYRAIERAIRGNDPEGRPVPYMIPGFTDSFAYGRLGSACYGFVPMQLPKDLNFSRLFHGHDERIPVEGFAWGVQVLYELVSSFCSGH